MINTLIADKSIQELEAIRHEIRDLAAFLTDEKWNVFACSKWEQLHELLAASPLLHLACFDITTQDGFDELLKMRADYVQTGLLIVVDASMSPAVYMRPSVHADSLLIRPLQKDMMRTVLREFITAYTGQEDHTDRSFSIETQEGRVMVPYNDIYYFESRAKKIYLRTLNEEYGFYDTLDELEKRLPEQFLRCHRSFIANAGKVKRIRLSQNYITLQEEFEIPLSRSYKPVWKDYGKKS